MAPVDPNLRVIVVLIAEHLERASSATAQDATAISRSLHRMTAALQTLRTAGGGQ